jgi:hypothetical protein
MRRAVLTSTWGWSSASSPFYSADDDGHESCGGTHSEVRQQVRPRPRGVGVEDKSAQAGTGRDGEEVTGAQAFWFRRHAKQYCVHRLGYLTILLGEPRRVDQGFPGSGMREDLFA